jgi:hypothetical protein
MFVGAAGMVGGLATAETGVGLFAAAAGAVEFGKGFLTYDRCAEEDGLYEY